jgi:hypothetical protein
MIEVHDDPERALSDGAQSLSLEAFEALMKDAEPHRGCLLPLLRPAPRPPLRDPGFGNERLTSDSLHPRTLRASNVHPDPSKSHSTACGATCRRSRWLLGSFLSSLRAGVPSSEAIKLPRDERPPRETSGVFIFEQGKTNHERRETETEPTKESRDPRARRPPPRRGPRRRARARGTRPPIFARPLSGGTAGAFRLRP